MRKVLILLLALLLTFTAGCDKEEEFIDDLDGKYTYYECVYLNFLSSSTLEYDTERYSGIIYLEFGENELSYYGSDEVLHTYENISYVKKKINTDLDDVISLDLNGVFDSFENRYDVYNDGESIGLTLFTTEDTLFLAETRMLGGSSNIFTVWSIFEIRE